MPNRTFELQTLKPHDLCRASIPHIFVQSITRIHDQRSKLTDLCIIDRGMLGADDRTVALPDQVVSKIAIGEGFSFAYGVGVIERDFRNERIVLSDLGSTRSEEIDYRERRRFAHIIDIFFIRYAED